MRATVAEAQDLSARMVQVPADPVGRPAERVVGVADDDRRQEAVPFAANRAEAISIALREHLLKD